MRRMLRAKLKRMECLLQHQDSKRVETIPWYNRYEDYFFDWRWYEQKGISHALMMCIYDDVEEAIEQETKWRKKAKRRAYGK